MFLVSPFGAHLSVLLVSAWHTKRYQLALLYSLGFAVQGMLMYNLSISIVCMVNPQHISNNAEANNVNVSTEMTRNGTMPLECSDAHNLKTSRSCGQVRVNSIKLSACLLDDYLPSCR